MKLKISFICLIILLGFIFVIKPRITSNSTSQKPSAEASKTQNNSPKIVSTKPDPLENAVVSANQPIEITFNLPLQNTGEFKSRIEPKIDYKVELSGDRKTAKITPIKPLELGSTYTLFIGTDTKFDGAGSWGQEKIFHFQTIKYSGV